MRFKRCIDFGVELLVTVAFFGVLGTASYFVDIVHPKPEGHRLIAEAIVAVATPEWQRFAEQRGQ